MPLRNAKPVTGRACAIARLQPWQHLKRSQLVIWVAIVTGLLIVLTSTEFITAKPVNFLTATKSHPLPRSLNQWQDLTNSGDYFDRVKLTEVGYLIWSQFPIKVHIDDTHVETWLQVKAAVKEWNSYLPLQIVEKPDIADIRISFKTPLLGTTEVLRARSALTRYELYIKRFSNSASVLAHHCTIILSPNQPSKYIKAAALHELGHALGIWGHSLVTSDALYFSQVSNPPSISPRDINTLKRIYQHPTLLGWKVAGEKDY